MTVFVRIEIMEHMLQVFLVVQVRLLQARCNKLVVVQLAVLVSVHRLHQVLQLFKRQILLLSLDHLIELLYGQITVTVFVYLAESLSQRMNLFLGQLGGNESDNYRFELSLIKKYSRIVCKLFHLTEVKLQWLFIGLSCHPRMF